MKTRKSGRAKPQCGCWHCWSAKVKWPLLKDRVARRDFKQEVKAAHQEPDRNP